MERGKQVQCVYCESTNGYVRITSREFVCRKCGKVTPLKEKAERK